MGCAASSHLFEDDEGVKLSGPGGLVSHHIVSLTSTTYGLLTLDSPQPQSMSTEPNSPKPGLSPISLFPSPRPSESPEIINSWELMAGLDTDSFRFSPIPKSSLLHTVSELDSRISRPKITGKENANRPVGFSPTLPNFNVLKPLNGEKTDLFKPSRCCYSLDQFEKRCPLGGENAVVIYTTTLRGIRKTFEECNAVRAVMEGIGVRIIERDVSMDSGFREELRELMNGKVGARVPRVFVRGRDIGGAEEVLRIHEEGGLSQLVEGLPKCRIGVVCDGCGGVRFLPCFRCSGSCKIVKEDGKKVLRCPDCNENGLVLCPICS
ncbi:uncharacterized protein At5g39865-like [Tasmannia lanceolata]|uniref:uncharacterized protein At5g39865-like n=1 Tax=Tasmannia lanceolata TaxID=3420 RepID=UPI0040642627